MTQNKTHELLFEELKKIGYVIEELPGTNITIATRNNKRLFFIEDHSPLIPHSVGLVLTSPRLIKNVVALRGVRTSAPDETFETRVRVYYDRNGFLSAFSNEENVTEQIHPSIRTISEQVLKSFPGLPQLSFELFTHDLASDLLHQYIVTHVSGMVSPFYLEMATNGSETKTILACTLQCIADQFDN